jgi:hypothetical protein
MVRQMPLGGDDVDVEVGGHVHHEAMVYVRVLVCIGSQMPAEAAPLQGVQFESASQVTDVHLPFTVSQVPTVLVVPSRLQMPSFPVDAALQGTPTMDTLGPIVAELQNGE